MPFGRGELPIVGPWFEDRETQRWLGDRSWPQQALALDGAPLGEFRGARETGCRRYLAWADGEAVGYIDCGTCDRWTTWDEEGGVGRVVHVIEAVSGAIAFVVNPSFRRRGYGVAMITALVRLSDLAHVQVFAAGVEPENTAAVRSLTSAGFEPLDPDPDWEGIVYYARRRW